MSKLSLFKLFTGALFCASVPTYATTAVLDRNSSELTALKRAVETAYKTQCPKVLTTREGTYSLDLRDCLPSKIVRVLGKSASIGGPNCYNFALFSTGVLDSLRAVNSAEVEELYLTEKSSVCSKVAKGKPQPGNLISMEQKLRRTDTRKIHAYVYLTPKYALTKNGPDTDSKWEISTLESIFAAYPIAEKEKLQVRYVCKRPSEVVRTDVAAAVRAISQFSEFNLEMQLATNLTTIPVNQVKAEISALSQSLSTAHLQMLFESSSNPAVRIKLYELVSHLYSVKLYYYELTKISETEGQSFRPYAEMYLEIIDRLLNVSDQEFGVSEVSNGDDSLEYEYCQQDQTKKICNAGGSAH